MTLAVTVVLALFLLLLTVADLLPLAPMRGAAASPRPARASRTGG
jgi:hypothetical protein